LLRVAFLAIVDRACVVQGADAGVMGVAFLIGYVSREKLHVEEPSLEYLILGSLHPVRMRLDFYQQRGLWSPLQ
jgi:hypothetical protein